MEPLSLVEWPLLAQPHQHTNWPPCAHMELHDIADPHHFYSPHSSSDWASHRRGRLGGYAQAAKRGATRRTVLEALGVRGHVPLPTELQLQIFSHIFEGWQYEVGLAGYEEMESTIRRLFAGYSNPVLEEVALTALRETVRDQDPIHQSWIESGLDVGLTRYWHPEPSNVRYLEICVSLDMMAYMYDWNDGTGLPPDAGPTVEERRQRSLQFADKYKSLRILTIDLFGSTEEELVRLLSELSSEAYDKMLSDFLDGLEVLRREKRVKVVIEGRVPSQRKGVEEECPVSASLDGSITGEELCGALAERLKDIIEYTQAREDYKRGQNDRTMSD